MGLRLRFGVGQKPTDEYGRNCLIARRLVERGVRFIQLYSGGGHLEETWDAHLPMDPEGEICDCGRKGCLETIASDRALARLVSLRIGYDWRCACKRGPLGWFDLR